MAFPGVVEVRGQAVTERAVATPHQLQAPRPRRDDGEARPPSLEPGCHLGWLAGPYLRGQPPLGEATAVIAGQLPRYEGSRAPSPKREEGQRSGQEQSPPQSPPGAPSPR